MPSVLLDNTRLDRLHPAQLQVPLGVSRVEWLLSQLGAVGALPPDLDLDRLFDGDATATTARARQAEDTLLLLLQQQQQQQQQQHQPVPEVVATMPLRVPMSALGIAATTIPGWNATIWTARVTRGATPSDTAARIRQFLPPLPPPPSPSPSPPPSAAGQLLQRRRLQYRGTDRRARGGGGGFVPSVGAAGGPGGEGGVGELGCGVYTSPSLEYACHLSGEGDGLVYVFWAPTVDGLSVLPVRGAGGGGSSNSSNNNKRRMGWRTDVVLGALRAGEEAEAEAEEGELVQCVWRSGEACRRLAEACVAVFFVVR